MDLCDEDEDVSQSAHWVRAVDRGGLVHVSENTFFLFLRIEIFVRSVFNKEKIDVVISVLPSRLGLALDIVYNQC